MASSSPIPLGQQVGPVTVGNVDQPDRVWICLDDPCNQLMEELEAVQDSLVRLDSSKVDVGLLAATIFSEDGALYRAEVLRILPGEEEVEVRYVDYGNSENVKRNSLLALPPKLKSAAKLAVAVALEGVDPRSVGNSEKNRAKIAKKLGKEGLMVELKEFGGNLVATFFAEGKKIKFTKSPSTPTNEENTVKEVETGSNETKIEDRVENSHREEVPVEEIKSVKLLKSGEVTMVSELPALALLENVEITGQVQTVSPMGSVWFSPKWILDDLDKILDQLDKLEAEKQLVPVMKADINPGMLAAVKHTEYGNLFRARVQEVEGGQVKVKYIDYGDSEQVPLTNIYYFPSGLDMIAPGVAEIVLARNIPKIDPQRVLSEILINEEEPELIILKLETDESGARVGRFYRGGKEVKFDGLVETRTVFSKDEVMAADDDVVVESEEILQPELKGKNGAAVLEEKVSEKVEKIVQPEPTQTVAPVQPTKTAGKENQAELFKMVEPRPLEINKEVAVYTAHVESVSRVWVSRVENEEAIQAMMDQLTDLQKTLTKATRKKPGAVFGVIYSDDGELYRVVLKDKAGPGNVLVQYIDFGNSEVVPVESLMNLPRHIAVVPSYAIPVDFSSGLENSPESLELVTTTLEQDNLTVTIVDGEGQFKINGREVFGSAAQVSSPEIEPSTLTPVSEQQKEEVPAKAVEIPKKDQTKSDEKIEVPLPTPSVVRDLVKKFDEKSQKELESGGKIDVTAGGDMAVPRPIIAPAVKTDLIKSQKAEKIPQKSPNVVQVVKSRPMENGVAEPVAESVAEPVALTVSEGKTKTWVTGTVVVAKFPGAGWSPAMVLSCGVDGVQISTSLEGIPVLVPHCDVKSSLLPIEALNMVERDLNRNVRMGGEISVKEILPSVTNTDKVSNWIDHNNMSATPSINQGIEPLPANSELGKYSTTSAGSRHLQTLIGKGNYELNRHILTSLLESNISCYSLMTGSVSTYVLQKLITMLPTALLEPLITEVLENFLRLCQDSVGCRVVQVLLEHSSQDQQLCLLSFLSQPEILLTLATHPSGTFVAQAGLPLLAPHQEWMEALAVNLIGQISSTALTQAGSFFLQKLIGFLASHHAASPALHLIKEEIIQNLGQLVMNEPGSRLVQQIIIQCQDMQLVLAGIRWVEENIQDVVLAKSAVHLALVLLEQLAAEASSSKAWAGRLDKFILHFTNPQDLIVSAALHPTGYLLAKMLVSNLGLISEDTRQEVMQCLSWSVDLLKASKTGVFVLKALE